MKHHPLSITTAAEVWVQAKDEAENQALAYDYTLYQGLRIVENSSSQFAKYDSSKDSENLVDFNKANKS